MSVSVLVVSTFDLYDGWLAGDASTGTPCISALENRTKRGSWNSCIDLERRLVARDVTEIGPC